MTQPAVPLSAATPPTLDAAAPAGAGRALASVLSAYLMWGVVGWFFQVVTHRVAPWAPSASLTLLAQRAVWSLLFILLVLGVRGDLSAFGAAFRDRRVLLGLVATSLLIATNWITFIYAAHAHLLLSASVGYFLSPLMTVLLGVVLLGERLRGPQWIAVALACGGVAVLALAMAEVVWIPLALMSSWSFYVLLRKRIAVGPIVGLGVETAILTPLALGYVAYDVLVAGTRLPLTPSLLLASSGVVTALPLILFAYAARRLAMSTLGLAQYVGPTVQFFVATLVLHEALSPTKLAGFALIWCGLILFTVDGLRRFRGRGRSAD